MRMGYGRKRIFWYAVLGVLAGGSILLLHNLTEWYLPEYRNLILSVIIPVMAAALALLAFRENAVYRWGSRLDDARRRGDELMITAVANKKWQQSLSDPSLATCWRELDCSKKDCPVYGREHARCWLIAGTFCRGQVQGKFARKLKDCRLCQIYQQATVDPVNQITENFMAMNYLLGEREEQLQEAYDEAKDRGEKLAGLVALSEAALSSVHLTEVMQNLLESAAAFTGADIGYVSLVDKAGENLVTRVTYGLPAGAAASLTVKAGEGVVGRAFAGTYAAVSEDLSIDGRFVNPYLKSLKTRTLISLPLIGRGQPLGMLTLGTFSPHHYTVEEKDSLSVAADRIAAAIENARLETELSRGRDQMELMETVSRDLSSQEGISGIYNSFIYHAARLIDFDRACMILWHPETEETEILAVNTKAPRSWLNDGLRLPKDSTPAGEVIASGRSLLRHEIKGDEYPADKLLVEEGVRSSIFIPLISKGEVLGTVNLDSFQPHAFSHQDLELLEPVARQLGLVLDNARLRDQTKRHALVDNLTGLYNHRYFYEAVVREISRSNRHGSQVSVMLFGLDGFKDFNLGRGHFEGDRVLKEIAAELRSTARQGDIVARYGGEEFAVLLPELGVTGESGSGELTAVRIAGRIRDAIAGSVFTGESGEKLPLSLSAGMAEYPAHAFDAATLLERADWALREAKASKGDFVIIAQKTEM